jgi:transposase
LTGRQSDADYKNFFSRQKWQRKRKRKKRRDKSFIPPPKFLSQAFSLTMSKVEADVFGSDRMYFKFGIETWAGGFYFFKQIAYNKIL